MDLTGNHVSLGEICQKVVKLAQVHGESRMKRRDEEDGVEGKPGGRDSSTRATEDP